MLLSTPVNVLDGAELRLRGHLLYLQSTLGDKTVTVQHQLDSSLQKRRQGPAYERFSSIADGPMLILALVMVPTLLLPFVVKVSPAVQAALDAIDYFVWALFVLEYCVRLLLARNRKNFFFHNIPDLVVVVIPFLRPLRLATGAVRILSLTRLVAMGGKVLDHAGRILAHRGIHYALLVVVLLVFVAAAFEWQFEAHTPGSNIHSYADALWWAFTTISTVGYGDRYPVSAGGRGVAVVLMITGIAMFGVLTATISSYFIEQRGREAQVRLDDLIERLDRIEILLTAGLGPLEINQDFEAFDADLQSGPIS